MNARDAVLVRRQVALDQGGDADAVRVCDEILAALVQDRPAFPGDGMCVCGASDWRVQESGYHRSSRVAIDDGEVFAVSNGWDDMSETGDDEWIECEHCGVEYSTPDEMAWT